mgnify:CR=1 FL=1
MVSAFLLLVAMIWCHLDNDFRKQGILASMKQKSWWEQQDGYNDMYKHDYIAALWTHAIWWGIELHIPVIAYIWYKGQLTPAHIWLLVTVMVAQIMIHKSIDDAKANQKLINLIIDQALHVFQILTSFVCALIIGNL